MRVVLERLVGAVVVREAVDAVVVVLGPEVVLGEATAAVPLCGEEPPQPAAASISASSPAAAAARGEAQPLVARSRIGQP